MGQEPGDARMVRAADALLSALEPEQRQRVLYAFDDDRQRARWSNFPTAVVPRGGVSLREMTPAQRSLAMALVAAALSPRGLRKVQQIMEGDEVNRSTDRGPGGGHRPPEGGDAGRARPSGRPPVGNGQLFGKDLYCISPFLVGVVSWSRRSFLG